MEQNKRNETGVKRNETKKKRKKLSGLDKYVIFSFVMLITYTITEMYMTRYTGIEHSTLTTCFFGAFGGEVLMCALIKSLKLKKEEKTYG